jgi:ketosteroid isomerase-like protein
LPDDDDVAEVEQAYARLVAAYSHRIDFGDAASVADLFTDDGVWESPELTMAGRDRIRAGFGRRQANAARRSRHVCTNLAVEVVGADVAEGVCYFTLYRADGVEPDRAAPLDSGPVIVGDYHDRLVRTAEGWRIAHRRATAAFQR